MPNNRMSRVNQRRASNLALDCFHEPELALAAAILVKMVEDMRGVKCSRDEQQDARTFLYSAWCEALCDGLGLSYYTVRHMARAYAIKQ